MRCITTIFFQNFSYNIKQIFSLIEAKKKIFLDINFFTLIEAENPQVFLDSPDWKKFSDFSLISLIGGNPARVLNSAYLRILAVLCRLRGCSPGVAPHPGSSAGDPLRPGAETGPTPDPAAPAAKQTTTVRP